MDPASALGLAGNIVQFIDLACKLFSKTKEIHKNGSVVEYGDIQIVNDDLRVYVEGLRHALKPTARQPPSSDEQGFQSICDGCLKVAEELEQALKAMQILGNKTKWKSFRQALKAIWGKSRLVELKSRVDLYGEQLDRRLLEALRTSIVAANSMQSEQYGTLNASLVEQTTNTVKELWKNRLFIEDANDKILETIRNSMRSNQEAHKVTHMAIDNVLSQVNENSRQIACLATEVLHYLKQEHESRQRHVAPTPHTDADRYRVFKWERAKQTLELENEIRVLREQLEESSRRLSLSVDDKAGREEREQLKDVHRARSNLRIAKELVLSKLLVSWPRHPGDGGGIGVDWGAVLDRISRQLKSHLEKGDEHVHQDLDDWGTESDGLAMDFAEVPGAEDIPAPPYEAVSSYTTSLSAHSKSAHSSLAMGGQPSSGSYVQLSRSDWSTMMASRRSALSDGRLSQPSRSSWVAASD